MRGRLGFVSLLVLAGVVTLAAPSSAKLVTPAGWSFESNVSSRKLGESVATAGDVNGDGYSDVVALGENVSTTVLYVFLGSASGLTLAPGYPLTNLPSGGSGLSVAGVGDVNGDGYADVGVGLGQPLSGTFRVYYGSASGLQTTGFFDLTQIAGPFADVVRPAGDVNGDGYDDVLVGSPRALSASIVCGGGSSITGAFEIFYGSASGMNGANRQTSYGCQWAVAGSGFGRAISTAGDVNGDGYDDVLVGATTAYSPSRMANVGAVWVAYGSASGLPTLGATINLNAGTRIEGYNAATEFGAAVAPAGDVNNDGYADVAVGAPYEDTFGSDAGQAWVFRGGSAGPDTVNKIWYESSGLVNGHMGTTLAPAGDQNGDGRPDLLVGQSGQVDLVASYGSGMLINQALGYDPASLITAPAGDVNGDGFGDVVIGDQGYSNGESVEGRLIVHYGVGDGPATSSSWEVTTALNNPNLGWSVACVGDLNGDGYDDFAVGAPTRANGPDANAGEVLLYYGAQGGPSTAAGWFYFGAAGDQVGISLAAAGDVNGDGYADLIVGAHQGGNAGNGKALLWYGRPSGPAGFPDRVLTGFTFGSIFGASVAGAGDVNGDGYADVVIGAPWDEDPVTPLTDEGRAFLYLGGPAGLGASPAWSDHGAQADAHYGNSVASSGDTDGDGFSDVIVGAPDFDTKSGPLTFADTGKMWVYRGRPSGAPIVLQATITGPVSGRFGASVASAGDVNGDGYSDVIVGAPSWNTQGMVIAFAGSPSGLSTSGFWTQAGGESFGNFGSSVASAGDVNGDGLSDVLVGAVFQDGGGAQDRGHAAVYLGPLPSGAGTAWDVYGPSAFANLGHCVASAGDVDNDGWSDLIFGMPGYTNAVSRQGLVRLYRGARGFGMMQRATAYLPSNGLGIPPLGLTNPNNVGLAIFSISPVGRTKVQFEWRVQTSPALAAPVLTGFGPWFATSIPSPYGSGATLFAYESRLVNGLPYAWRARARWRSVYFPFGPWRTSVRNGVREWDFRAPGTWVGVAPLGEDDALELAAAHPNPARGASSVWFRLRREGPVSLTVVDVQGRRVRVLEHGTMPAGRHEASWDGRDEQHRLAGAGLYFVRLEAEGEVLSRKLTMLR